MHLYALIALSVTASAFHVPLLARDDTCDDSVADTESPFDDGPINSNVDATAGIGAEFESPGLFFRRDKQCSEDEDNTFELKGKTVIGRTGTETPPHWRLTGDTTENRGKLFAEYITDGKVVKVGSGDAVAAANSIVNDLEVSLTLTIRLPLRSNVSLFSKHGNREMAVLSKSILTTGLTFVELGLSSALGDQALPVYPGHHRLRRPCHWRDFILL